MANLTQPVIQFSDKRLEPAANESHPDILSLQVKTQRI